MHIYAYITPDVRAVFQRSQVRKSENSDFRNYWGKLIARARGAARTISEYSNIRNLQLMCVHFIRYITFASASVQRRLSAAHVRGPVPGKCTVNDFESALVSERSDFNKSTPPRRTRSSMKCTAGVRRRRGERKVVHCRCISHVY